MVLVEHTRTWGDLPNWRYGRLLRHHFQQFARTLVLFEGDTEPTELGFNPDLYVCDDPALAKRIRDIEEEIEAWNEEREYFKKKLTRKIGHHELRFRASLVKLAKAQMRRLKTKA
jgi:hypothetical protein